MISKISQTQKVTGNHLEKKRKKMWGRSHENRRGINKTKEEDQGEGREEQGRYWETNLTKYIVILSVCTNM